VPRPARAVDSALLQKGFRSHNSDHVYYYLHVDGRKTMIRTKISHNARDITENLLALMARQVKLTKRQFLELVDCPLTNEQYVRLLRAGNHIS
jgi:hypothetical protein